jgi:signal transduction histidine kinase
VTADALLQFLTQAVYFLVFLYVSAQAVRRPSRANVDTAIFFGVLALIIAWQWVSSALAIERTPLVSTLTGILLMSLPYTLLRLVDDFSDVPRWVMRAAEAGLALSVVALAVMATWPAGDPRRLAPTIALVVYFVAFELYAAVKFVLEARRTSGVTSRRMQAVALGSVFLGLVLALVLPGLALPQWQGLWMVLSRLCGLASGVAYALGFAPPGLLRRAWQEPELRAFLGRAARLPRLPDTDAIVREIQLGAAAATGAPYSIVGLWEAETGLLRYAPTAPDQEWVVAPPERFITGRAFRTQQALYVEDAPRADPENAAVYAQYNAKAVLVAPITAGAQRLGVLSVFASRPPIFADDDLVLVQLLADQAAVVLESRALIDEAARVRAREEATRLRDDFLSSAAHDLKTPLTTLMAQAQLMERRALRDREAPADLAGIQRLVQETRRLNGLVLELLDASRAEQGRLLGPREPVDLAALAAEACARYSTERHPCRLDASGAVVARVDDTRIQQLVNNLLENAIKYSPGGGPIDVRVWSEGETACLRVRDRGIGIPAADLPHIFDRFHRARNVDDRQFAGMGLGLFICRAIVQEHGGAITVDSAPGEGTTFEVSLQVEPLAPQERPLEVVGGAADPSRARTAPSKRAGATGGVGEAVARAAH